MQKLKMSFFHLLESLFTCFLKDKTLHNHWDYAGFTVPYYNIPSNNRELQRSEQEELDTLDYNIPSNNRELQLQTFGSWKAVHYNIPSNNRELQPGTSSSRNSCNYNIPSNNRELQHQSGRVFRCMIITYQVITGNYSLCLVYHLQSLIITYQVITGNYSLIRCLSCLF